MSDNFIYFTHSDCSHRPENIVGAAAYGPFETKREAAEFGRTYRGKRNGEFEKAHVVAGRNQLPDAIECLIDEGALGHGR